MLRQWHLSPSFTLVVSAPFLSSPPASCSSIPPKLVGLTCFCPFCISPSPDVLGDVSLLEDARASSRPLCFVPAHPMLPLCSWCWGFLQPVRFCIQRQRHLCCSLKSVWLTGV